MASSRIRTHLLGAAALSAAVLAAAVAAPAAPPPAGASASPAASPAPAGSESSTEPSGEPPGASSTASATESASAAPSGSAAAAAALPVLRGADIPADTSDKPKEAEWKQAKKVRPNRGKPGDCELSVVREWLRVTCKRFAGLGLVAGDPKGITLWTAGDFQMGQPLSTFLQLPVTRGTSRIFSLMVLDGGYDWVGLAEGGTLDIVWRDGDADPSIGLYTKSD